MNDLKGEILESRAVTHRKHNTSAHLAHRNKLVSDARSIANWEYHPVEGDVDFVWHS
jgi:hypothetical protein